MATSHDTTSIKVCPRCNKSLPRTNHYYYRNRSEFDGFQSACRVCQGYKYFDPDGVFSVDSLPGEEWRDLPDYVGLYRISNLGRVLSLPHFDTRGEHRIGRIRKQSIRKKGYYQVMISKDGIRKSIEVHCLVAASFLGKRPEGLVINHKDANKLNNHIDNLEYCTPIENVHHAMANNLLRPARGQAVYAAKLNEDKVRQIRKLSATGKGFAEIGRLFGVSDTTIGRVIKGINWGYIPND